MSANGNKTGLSTNMQNLIHVGEGCVFDLVVRPIHDRGIRSATEICPQQTPTGGGASGILDTAECTSCYVPALDQRRDKAKGLERVTNLITEEGQVHHDAASMVNG